MPTHIALGRSVGLDEEHLAAIDSQEPARVFSAVEKVVVDYSRRLTRVEQIDDAMYDELRRYFTLQELMELCSPSASPVS